MIGKLALKKASPIGVIIRFVLSQKLLELPSDLCMQGLRRTEVRAKNRRANHAQALQQPIWSEQEQ